MNIRRLTGETREGDGTELKDCKIEENSNWQIGFPQDTIYHHLHSKQIMQSLPLLHVIPCVQLFLTLLQWSRAVIAVAVDGVRYKQHFQMKSSPAKMIKIASDLSEWMWQSKVSLGHTLLNSSVRHQDLTFNRQLDRRRYLPCAARRMKYAPLWCCCCCCCCCGLKRDEAKKAGNWKGLIYWPTDYATGEVMKWIIVSCPLKRPR